MLLNCTCGMFSRYALGLFDTFGKDSKSDSPSVRPIEVYMCSVVKRMGYADGEARMNLAPIMTHSDRSLGCMCLQMLRVSPYVSS